MIDIKRNKRKYHAQILNQNAKLDAIFSRTVVPILGRQWLDVAKFVEKGTTSGIELIISFSDTRFINAIKNWYRRVGSVYLDEVITRVEETQPKGILSPAKIKGTTEEFWYGYNTWLQTESVRKVTKLNKTTTKVLRNIIDKGIREGKGTQEIATDIRKLKGLSNATRAKTIARTETHSAMTESTDRSVDAAPVKIESKDWLSALDERTRKGLFNHVTADGESVPKDEFFVRTGESLMYPGDTSGSAGNIILCRCITLYNT